MKAIEEEFPEPRPSQQQLGGFLGRLEAVGILVLNDPGHDAQLIKRAEERKKAKRGSIVTSLLYIKFKGFDPERFLTATYPYVAWMFHPLGVAAAVSLWLFAAGYTIVNIDAFLIQFDKESLRQFMAIDTLAWLWLALGISKVLHELGHGYAVKHFGGECHDMGMLFLVLSPCLYCDASDAWTMPNKWHRIAISFGGIYVELCIASIATLTWWFTAEGMLHSIALALMAICSVNTLFLNANPLMRYDGYYILSDLLEVPNLRQKAQMALQAFYSRNFFGRQPLTRNDNLTGGRRAMFILYGIAAWIYRWFLCFVILWVFYNLLRPYRLGTLSAMVATVIAVQMLVVPSWKRYQMSRKNPPQGPRNWKRMAVFYSILGALLAAAFLVPLPHRVSAQFIVEGDGQLPLHVEVPGRLEEVRVKPNQMVRQGDVIAVLSNDGLEMEIARLTAEVETLQARVVRYSANLKPAEAQATEKLLAQRRRELESRQEQARQLTILAPADGMIIPAERNVITHHKYFGYAPLPNWTDAPLQRSNLGTWLSAGTVVGQIRPSDELVAVLYVRQSDIAFVEVGQEVRLKLDSLPDAVVPARIVEIARREAEQLPRQVLSIGGGSMPARQHDDGSLGPAINCYEVRAKFDSLAGLPEAGLDKTLRFGSRGRGKIEAGTWTFAELVTRSVYELLFL